VLFHNIVARVLLRPTTETDPWLAWLGSLGGARGC